LPNSSKNTLPISLEFTRKDDGGKPRMFQEHHSFLDLDEESNLSFDSLPVGLEDLDLSSIRVLDESVEDVENVLDTPGTKMKKKFDGLDWTKINIELKGDGKVCLILI
jgi:hypothetical protein